jgi:hypothetical protein
MKVRFSFLGAMAMLFTPTLWAATYSFSTPNYTTIANFTSPCGAGTCANFTSAMNVAGSFTTTSPLAANLSNADVSASVVSYSFFDGVDTISSTLLGARKNLVQVSTDASGAITTFEISFTLWTTGTNGSHAPGDRISYIALENTTTIALTNDSCQEVSADTCFVGANNDPSASLATGSGPAPTVTSLSPTSGPLAGGTTVTLTGTFFTGATAVKFGTAAAGSFTVTSATTITATAPAGTGVVNVTVTTPNGTSAAAAGNQFTYGAPPTPPSSVPTLSVWGQMALAGLLMLAALAALRRRTA